MKMTRDETRAKGARKQRITNFDRITASPEALTLECVRITQLATSRLIDRIKEMRNEEKGIIPSGVDVADYMQWLNQEVEEEA